MLNQSENTPNISPKFWQLVIKTFKTYQNNFINYLLLSIVIHLPFLILNKIMNFDGFGISGFFISRFIDALVFLSMPSIFNQQSISIKDLFQKFFLKNFYNIVMIILLQLFLFSPLFVMSGNHPLFLILSFIIYVFFLFSIFCMLIEKNAPQIKSYVFFQQSASFVHQKIQPVFFNLLGILILSSIPISIFTMQYFSFSKIQSFNDSQLLLNYLNTILEKPSFQLGTTILQIILRPIESIFISLLFINLMMQSGSKLISSYLFKQNHDNT